MKPPRPSPSGDTLSVSWEVPSTHTAADTIVCMLPPDAHAHQHERMRARQRKSLQRKRRRSW